MATVALAVVPVVALVLGGAVIGPLIAWSGSTTTTQPRRVIAGAMAAGVVAILAAIQGAAEKPPGKPDAG